MTTESKRKRGGQPKENPATERLPAIRVTPAQAKKYKATARKRGKSFSEWARDLFEKDS